MNRQDRLAPLVWYAAGILGFAFAFSFLSVALWGWLRHAEHNSEIRLAVGGSWLWLLLNPVAGALVAAVMGRVVRWSFARWGRAGLTAVGLTGAATFGTGLGLWLVVLAVWELAS